MFYKIGILKSFAIQKTRLSESLSSNVVSFYPATLLKKKTPGDCFCTTENNKEPQKTEKIKKWRLLVKKTKTHRERKLKHYLPQVFTSFYLSKISLFLFFLFPMIY